VNRLIQLREYDCIYIQEKVAGRQEERQSISLADFENLKNFILENEKVNKTLFLKITTKNNQEVLQAQNYVGIIQLKSGITIEILPKITNLENNIDDTKKILIKMLKTLKNSPFKTFQLANLKTEKMPLLEIFIQMFLDELAILVRKGIKSDYINIEENQSFLKGKLKINEQLKYNFIHKERFFINFDEYLPDRIENKIIKTTLLKIYDIAISFSIKQRIRTFLFIFDQVEKILNLNYSNFLKNLKIDRTINYYETVLLWCKTFLLKESFTPYSGKNIAFALLFDMNSLFESYVSDWIKKHCNHSVKLQDTTNYLVDKPKKFQLRPDIVLDDGEVIMDTKWKLVKCEEDISQTDLYQMFAYASKYKNCEKVYIVYPFEKNVFLPEYNTVVCEKNVKIIPVFFDLSKDCMNIYKSF